MAQNFGKTWWGEKWLNSLNNIDYSNRLPRGSNYARKGAVNKININNNRINAKVSGSRPKPYNVDIVLPPYFDPELGRFIDALASRPLIISKLFNRELNPEVLAKNKNLDDSLSGKLSLLFDKLDSILESNEKVLIFSQFTEMGAMLQHLITTRYNEAPLFYHGGCTLKQRKEMVERFHINHADKIFILSLKAAGTGLNLTAASHVIHYDLWWNPAVEPQATDRAYRIGQKSNVMVHRFITKNTFEERINEMIQSKKALAELTVTTGESWIGNLSNRVLKELFELG